MDRPPLPEAIVSHRVIAVARRRDPATMPAIADALVEGGVHVLEVTLDAPDALATLAELAARFEPGDLLLGAGTVLDAGMAGRAVDAGARFVVSPTIERDVLDVTAAAGIACLPGAMTPTELLAAWRLGASAVKLFPASAVGPSFVRELRGPLPDVPVVPTGGISAADAAAYLEAGAVAVGIGGWLTGSGDPRVVRERARELTTALGTGRGLASGR